MFVRKPHAPNQTDITSAGFSPSCPMIDHSVSSATALERVSLLVPVTCWAADDCRAACFRHAVLKSESQPIESRPRVVLMAAASHSHWLRPGCYHE